MSSGEVLANEIRSLLKSGGADIVGFADLRKLPADVRGGFPSGISIAVALDPGIVSEIGNGPTPRYHDEYSKVNRLLDSLGRLTATFLEEKGYNAAFAAATDTGIDSGNFSNTTDMATLSTRLPHKTVATRAGLGWIGKCALLITEQFGSALRLTSVLTDAELPYGEPKDSSECGDCRACVDACPGKAPSGKSWRASLPRESFFDAFTCRRTARALALKNIGIEVSVCGICIQACPWTRKYIEKSG
jgi:epoxyqueuosine reductase